MCITNYDDFFEVEDCPELEEAVYILKDGAVTHLEVPDDTEA